MKKLITIVSVLILTVCFNPAKSVSQTGYNAVLEYCTGTWCQWCPCGHSIVHDILQNYPNTVVLAYHGAGSDPWLSYSQSAVSAFGFTSYPSGVVSRKTGVVDRSAWNNHVVLQSLLFQPGVNISISNKSYDASTRTLNASFVITPNTTLSGDFHINFVVTENNLIYGQTGNGSCPGAGNYVHDHVVKNIINGVNGELIHSGTWTSSEPITKNLTFTLPSSPQVLEVNNCDLNVFVYKQGTSISANSEVQQSLRTSVTGTTGIQNQNEIPLAYSLSQNYPNPFNPTTTFSFSIPKDEVASLKFYDILGNEVATYLDGFIESGVYSVEFDASNLSSGVYFYKLTTANFTQTKKMLLSK